MIHMTLLFYLVIFIVGAILGSFLHVVTLRSLAGRSWVAGRSQCDRCKKKLGWWELLPLVSYIWLGGKCNKCHKSIAPSHFLMELGCGAAGVVTYYLFGAETSPLLWLIWWAVFLVGACLILADATTFLIPDWTVVLLGLLGLLRLFSSLMLTDTHSSSSSGSMGSILTTILASVLASAFFWFLWWVTKGRGMGLGDVKLVLVLGLLFEWPMFLVALYGAFFSGAIVGLTLLVSGRVNKRHIIPFGPFLILGSMMAVVWGDHIWQWFIGLLV